MSDTVLYEEQAVVAVLTLNRADSYNALTEEMCDDLMLAFKRAESSPHIRTVVIKGSGKAFMAGGDVKFFAQICEGDTKQNAGELRPMVDKAQAVIAYMRGMNKPILGVVWGACAGYGMSLMMACDLVIAAEETVFTLAYCHIGVTPDGGSTWHLPRLVGYRKAMELALLGDRFDGAEAKRLGLVNFLYPAKELEGEAIKLAGRIAMGPNMMQSCTKALFNGSWEKGLAEQLCDEAANFTAMALKPDFKEGVTAFVEKREPQFTDDNNKDNNKKDDE